MQEEHEKLPLLLLRFGSGFRQAQKPCGAGQAVVVRAERIKGFNQPDGGDGHVTPAFDDHIVPQGKKLRGVQVVGLRLAAVPDDSVDPAAGGAQEGYHAVIVPVIDPAQDDGGVFGLNHLGIL